jgi:[ribosomal protein S18]-alanine N-acetyltransferase
VKLELRKLELRDLNAIEAIERVSYPTPWSRSMFAGELAKPSSLSLGAFDPESGELVGYLVISRYVDAWHVMNVAVTPEHRRRGIARALLDRLFEVTASDERRGYTLEVRVSNEGAIKLYEAMGFVARGVRRGYYTDNREDALIMWKDPVALDSAESDVRIAEG